MLTSEEKHILRQSYWFRKLRKEGWNNVHLEKSLHNLGGSPKGAQVDVYAEKNGKVLIIEIGEIKNGKKRQVLKTLNKKGLIQFIWEHKGFEAPHTKRH